MEEVEKMANRLERVKLEGDLSRIRVKRKTLEAVLNQCQRALELLSVNGCIDEETGDDVPDDTSAGSSSSDIVDKETDEICSLLKSRLDCPEFLEKLETAQASVPPDIVEEGNSWDVVNEQDIWDDEAFKLGEEDFVLVRQEDIVDGIACFMAACLLSLKDTKDLTPNQLQEALSKTFSSKKKKGKFRKAWDGSKVIYNMASWGATAIGIYQNPAILKAATTAFWTSCHVISKLF